MKYKVEYNAMTLKQSFFSVSVLQMDKATLLARVVDQVKALKRKAREATRFPPESDQVSIECYTGGTDKILYIKASVSCDDRPELIAGIIQAFHGLPLRALRADLASLGGRVQHVFTLCKEDGSSTGASLVSLKESVRQALARAVSPEMVVHGSRPFQSKRQRVLESHYSVMST
jgi:UTP:GlnB (protein PII) uridylyltransferase